MNLLGTINNILSTDPTLIAQVPAARIITGRVKPTIASTTPFIKITAPSIASGGRSNAANLTPVSVRVQHWTSSADLADPETTGETIQNRIITLLQDWCGSCDEGDIISVSLDGASYIEEPDESASVFQYVTEFAFNLNKSLVY